LHDVGINDVQTVQLGKRYSRFLMPHQVEAIQALWREVVAIPLEQAMGHPMGKGRILTVILLHELILRTANGSTLSHQIPEDLRPGKLLIMYTTPFIDH
jgi:hypothetical protein